MLHFTEPRSLLVPRIAGLEDPFLWESCPTSPCPSLGLPSGHLEKGTLGPISLLPLLLPRAFTREIHFPFPYF